MTALSHLLDTYRNASASEREKGTYFEELTVCYLRNEATYKDLYAKVWAYADWAAEQGLGKNDAGIDLVAQTHTGDVHAIQCKLFATDYKLQKVDIDSFFTASGKKPFVHRVIVSTTNHWSANAEDALIDQQPPVSKIDLNDLENSQIDWALYQPKHAPVIKPKKELRTHQVRALAETLAGFKKESRGKLIMACGTGKTTGPARRPCPHLLGLARFDGMARSGLHQPEPVRRHAPSAEEHEQWQPRRHARAPQALRLEFLGHPGEGAP